jgi:hypothetical protein
MRSKERADISEAPWGAATVGRERERADLGLIPTGRTMPRATAAALDVDSARVEASPYTTSPARPPSAT